MRCVLLWEQNFKRKAGTYNYEIRLRQPNVYTVTGLVKYSFIRFLPQRTRRLLAVIEDVFVLSGSFDVPPLSTAVRASPPQSVEHPELRNYCRSYGMLPATQPSVWCQQYKWRSNQLSFLDRIRKLLCTVIVQLSSWQEIGGFLRCYSNLWDYIRWTR